jgi:hypothetical protein
MSWAKIDDQFSEHPKVIEAGPLAGWLYVRGLCYAAKYLTDGFISDAQAQQLSMFAGSSPELLQKLVDCSLWERVNGGYQIHDYLDYNPTAESVKAEREAAKLRMQNKRSKKAVFAESSPEVHPNFDGSSASPYPLILSKDSTAQAQPRAPKPKAEPKPEREPSETWIIAEVLAEVCKMDMTVNKGRLLKEAALLLKATPKPTPELLRQHYNGGGWWWANDWRGQRREFPQPATIRETWGKWGIEAPEAKPFAVEEWR